MRSRDSHLASRGASRHPGAATGQRLRRRQADPVSAALPWARPAHSRRTRRGQPGGGAPCRATTGWRPPTSAPSVGARAQPPSLARQRACSRGPSHVSTRRLHDAAHRARGPSRAATRFSFFFFSFFSLVTPLTYSLPSPAASRSRSRVAPWGGPSTRGTEATRSPWPTGCPHTFTNP